MEEGDGDVVFQHILQFQDVANESLAFLVTGVRLAGVDHLQSAGLRRDHSEAFEVSEEKISPLVGRDPASESDGEYFWTHREMMLFIDAVQQFCLRLLVRRTDFRRRNTLRMTQTEIVLSPVGNVTIIELLKMRRGPGGSVHA